MIKDVSKSENQQAHFLNDAVSEKKDVSKSENQQAYFLNDAGMEKKGCLKMRKSTSSPSE